MKIKHMKYIMISKKIAQEVLNAALATGADFAEIFLEETKVETISLDNGNCETATNSIVYGAGIRLLNKLYPLRKCHTIPQKVCLYYHIHQCLGPCEYEIPTQDYKPYIEEISRFLKGDYSKVKADLVKRMEAAAENLEFERAKEYRD